MDKKELYDRLRNITALKLVQENESLSIETRVNAGIAKVKARLKLAASRNPKPKEL